MACCSLEKVRVNHSPRSPALLAPLAPLTYYAGPPRCISTTCELKKQSNHTVAIFVCDVIAATVKQQEDHTGRREELRQSSSRHTDKHTHLYLGATPFNRLAKGHLSRRTFTVTGSQPVTEAETVGQFVASDLQVSEAEPPEKSLHFPSQTVEHVNE